MKYWAHKSLFRVICDRTGRSCLSVDVRFPPKATEALLSSEMSLRAITGLMHRSKGLFDDLVGQREQLIRNFQVKRLGGLHVEYPRRKHSYT
jgi:hypothetical protein